ncbi:hypothetical protein E1A91_D02G160800v1 [Gossypium mustelinum]|uniref:Uncharacterized protein n=1 Tax=Gossypium mustelinum TaxID=34275 RepID=A0A5D2VWP9_GOSMU|nr:hypothetical protein E1A91_D02G160800v1 [Gossypium mustelinum]
MQQLSQKRIKFSEYAKEVKRWFHPLHMAAVNGHIEVVKELMNVDQELWSGVEGKGNKTPFHFAAMKGRINVINDMLSRYEGCIQCATVQKDFSTRWIFQCRFP